MQQSQGGALGGGGDQQVGDFTAPLAEGRQETLDLAGTPQMVGGRWCPPSGSTPSVLPLVARAPAQAVKRLLDPVATPA
jgi:hypothetical protein